MKSHLMLCYIFYVRQPLSIVAKITAPTFNCFKCSVNISSSIKVLGKGLQNQKPSVDLWLSS